MKPGSHQGLSRSLLLLWGFVLVLPGSLHAQGNMLKVVFADSTRNTAIGLFQFQGAPYGSLTDLAQVFSLSTYENSAAQKLELKAPPYRVKVSGGNPFVVVSDQTGRQSVYQLPSSVIFAANSYFVPLQSFLPLLRQVFSIPATLDPAHLRLLVGVAETTPVFDIPTLRLEPKANGMLIRIPASKKLDDLECWLRQDGWLYVTIPSARADTAAIDSVRPAGIVRQIVAIQSPTSVQLTFRLSGKPESSEIVRSTTSHEVMISVRTAQGEEKVSPPERKAPSGKAAGDQKEIKSGLETQRKRWKLDVIVLDPGHGGRDPGAIGVTGVREKDITLGIALKLGRLIRKSLSSVRVVYTRSSDKFVELDRRGQIANEAGGKLFISIHCNSMPRKPSPSRGFEVYLLRPGRTEEAIAIAERENAVIKYEEGYESRYKELTEENFILVTMAQSAYVKSSEVFADLLQHEMEIHTGLRDQGVKQAGFYVLVGAAMPNVLVETAYLSNRQDERILNSDAGQERIAESILLAVKQYKEEYDKLLNEGKEFGESR